MNRKLVKLLNCHILRWRIFVALDVNKYSLFLLNIQLRCQIFIFLIKILKVKMKKRMLLLLIKKLFNNAILIFRYGCAIALSHCRQYFTMNWMRNLAFIDLMDNILNRIRCN